MFDGFVVLLFLFEIKFVEHEQPFYQLQKTYVYELKCELFRYEDEELNTDVDEIDERYAEDLPALRKIALLDAVVNNTDRKIGHLLFKNEMVYGCDHGVTFHADYKLRTVLWQFADENLTESEISALENFNLDLSGYLTESEIAALRDRIDELLKTRKFPLPPTDWPAVPWPPV